MIDTDKYEGHTEGPWALSKYTGVGGGARLHTHVKDKRRITDKSTVVFLPRRRLDELTKADTLLIVDAPLLLAEVERLREETKWFRERLCRHIGYDYCKSEYEKHFGREMIE